MTTPPPVPRARTGSVRRGRPGHDLESVLRTAVELFTEQGYDRTSMADLSTRLGISKSAIYHHVQGKEQLLELALHRALDGLVALAAETRRLDRPAIERLEYLVRGSVTVLHEQLPYVTLLLRVRGNTAVERQALQRRRQLDRYAATLVRAAERDGAVRPDVDPAIAARLLFGVVNSLVEWYRPGRAGSADDLADAVCRMAFDGLRIRPTTPDVPPPRYRLALGASAGASRPARR